jgi:hypothetical protein
MTNSAQKCHEELIIFNRFLNVSGLQIDKESIRSGKDGEPDIFCKYISGVPVYFELTRTIDEDLAQNVYGKNIKGGFLGESYEVCILKKNEKLKDGKYNIGSTRIELLVYLDVQPFFPAWNKTIPNFISDHSNEWIFNVIWFFDEHKELIIYKFPV